MYIDTQKSGAPVIEPGRDHRLRLGALIGSFVMPMWALRVLHAIHASQFCQLALILRMAGPALGKTRNRSGFLGHPRLFHLDEQLFGRRSAWSDALSLGTFEPPPGTAVLDCPSPAHDALPDDVAETVRKAELDILLQLETTMTSAKLLQLARLGVWSFPDCEQAIAKVLEAISRNSPTICNELKLQSGSDQSAIPLAHISTDHSSVFRNCAHLCGKRSDGLLRILSNVHDGDKNELGERARVSTAERQIVPPEPLSVAPRLLTNALTHEFQKQFTEERWFVGYRRIVNTEEIAGRTSFTVLWPPDGRYYADPFVVEHNGRAFIFFEDYSRVERKAVISFVELTRDGACSVPSVALRETSHLSYPCVMSLQGDIYMLPESKEARTIQLYRAAAFPWKWEPAQILFDDIQAVDSTLFECDGMYWLFTSGVGTADPWFDGDHELFLFYASRLEGPWRPHPRNPVVADVRRSRCAGRMFYLGKHLIRPAQDCSSCYGHAVVLNRVERLSTTEYHEVPIGRIGPEWMAGNRGTHTFNHSAHFEVLDGRTLNPRYRLRHRPAILETLTTTTQLLTPFK